MGESSNGHYKWGNWFFDYGVFGKEGLCLVDGYFNGQLMFNKLSLPVIRVKYVIDEFWDGASSLWPFRAACGPYNDQIEWDTEEFGESLNPIRGPHYLKQLKTSKGDRYIAIDPVLENGINWIRLQIYARIGAYHIIQTWSLNDAGKIEARVSSKGLSCNLDHWHHPYWRFDLALGMPSTHRCRVFHREGGEIASLDHESFISNLLFPPEPKYVITSTQPNPVVGRIEGPAQAVIIPPRINHHEGIVEANDFSPFDGYLRVFRPEEDRPWPHGVWEDIRFPVHEPCKDRDLVFWSICHLKHHASEGGDHLHTVGPDLLFEPMVIADIPIELMRMVDVSGAIHVKNFLPFEEDDWEHSTFAEQLFIDPNRPTDEVVVSLVSGDVTGELILRITWNPDASITVGITANLFDEAERVARSESQVNVLRDSSVTWTGLHLVDHHRTDQDTADFEFEIFNGQQT